MNTIKFSHYYDKMKPFALSRPFRLLEVLKAESFRKLSVAFLEYDMTHAKGRYYLNHGILLILLLEQDNRLMTTIRPWNPEKEEYYREKRGEEFMLVMEEKS